MLWLAVLGACVAAYLLKLSGYLVPHQVLERPWVARVSTLLPVALLSSLVVSQAFFATGGGGAVVLDARAAAVGVAVVALLLRAPFLLVVLLAALTAAGIRALGG